MPMEVGDLSGTEVHELLRAHPASMYELSPPDKVFALDSSKELTSRHREIGSIRTPARVRRRGAGGALLQHINGTAKQSDYDISSVETGSHPAFPAAHLLWPQLRLRAFGAIRCVPARPQQRLPEPAAARPVRPEPSRRPPTGRATAGCPAASRRLARTLGNETVFRQSPGA